MKNTKRKGFTIVELVIVIAVIAILAAVLIPTFASLINKANRSADIQAVHQMNTLLATYTDGSVENVADAIKALAKENIDLEDYKALQTGHYFYFTMNGDTPMVIYADEKDEIIYPEVKKEDLGQWMSLSGDVPMDNGWENKVSNEKVTISSAAQLADLMDKYSVDNSNATQVNTIVLENNIDLKGAAVDFGKVENDITLQGKEGSNVTLSGLREDSNATTGTWDGQTKNYGYAIFGNVATGVTVTVKNITVSNVVVENTKGNTAFGQSGVLFGTVNGTVSIENVTIENCTVVGGDKAASVIGYLSGSATMNNVKVTDTKILACGFAAKAVGMVSESVKTLTFGDGCDFNGVTTGMTKSEEAFNDIFTSSGIRDQNWDGKDVTINDTYQISENVTITGEYTWDNNKKVTKFSKENHKAVGNYYTLWKKANDSSYKASGAYTNDLYWANYTNTSVRINGKDVTINLSSNASRGDGLNTFSYTAN